MGVSNFDVLQANAYIGANFDTQGNRIFVRPYLGTGQGDSPKSALKTLAGALAKCTANRNDVVSMLADHSTMDYTTDLQSATLDWNLSGTHLIGSPPGSIFGSRCRIAFTDAYDAASNLFTLSGHGCILRNLLLFAGVAGTLPTGCMKVTGNRNLVENCQISGIGHDNNDIANAYSLYLSGSENTFRHCVIGLDTISRGTGDNAELVFAGGATRNLFEDCIFLTFAAANTHQFVKRAVSATDRSNIFKRCQFINFDWTAGGGVTMLEVFDVTASGSPAGFIDLFGCSFAGAAAWEASTGASGIVRADNVSAAAGSATTGGRALAVTGA
jgi:hypothetical protein